METQPRRQTGLPLRWHGEPSLLGLGSYGTSLPIIQLTQARNKYVYKNGVIERSDPSGGVKEANVSKIHAMGRSNSPRRWMCLKSQAGIWCICHGDVCSCGGSTRSVRTHADRAGSHRGPENAERLHRRTETPRAGQVEGGFRWVNGWPCWGRRHVEDKVRTCVARTPAVL